VLATNASSRGGIGAPMTPIPAVLSTMLGALVAPAPEPVPIVQGVDATTCEWPSVVALRTGGGTQFCSGVLVHPRIVLTAGHCVEPMTGLMPSTVAFGEDAQRPAGAAVVETCVVHPDYEITASGGRQQVIDDIAYCVLAEPVVGLPIVPVAIGCEADAIVPDASVTIVGFGASAGGIDNGQPWAEGNGRKRYTTQTIETVDASAGEVFVVGDRGNSACMGDSGGPALLRLDDGTWRVFGVASTAMLTSEQQCGYGSSYELVDRHVAWIEADADVDLSACFADDGTWAPDETCGGFPTSPTRTDAAWADACATTEVGDASASCGDPFDAGTDESGSSSEGTTTEDGGVHSTTDATSEGSAEETTDATTEGGSSSTTGAVPNGDPGCACGFERGAPSLAWVVLACIRRRRATTTRPACRAGYALRPDHPRTDRRPRDRRVW
jgi:hypothetical protein